MKLRKVRHRTLPFTVVALLRQLQLLRRRRGCRGGRNRSRHIPVVIRPRPNHQYDRQFCRDPQLFDTL